MLSLFISSLHSGLLRLQIYLWHYKHFGGYCSCCPLVSVTFFAFMLQWRNEFASADLFLSGSEVNYDEINRRLSSFPALGQNTTQSARSPCLCPNLFALWVLRHQHSPGGAVRHISSRFLFFSADSGLILFKQVRTSSLLR
jgi:hypothetical protein